VTLSPEAQAIRDQARSELRANAGLAYPENWDDGVTARAAWSDGTVCRCSIRDPNKTDAGYKLAQRLTGVPEVQDIRLLRVHLDDEPPGVGATLDFDSGSVKLLFWSQVSDYTGQAVGVCRFTR